MYLHKRCNVLCINFIAMADACIIKLNIHKNTYLEMLHRNHKSNIVYSYNVKIPLLNTHNGLAPMSSASYTKKKNQFFFFLCNFKIFKIKKI